MTKAAAKKTAAEPQACECQKFNAVDPAELTEENLASGDYAVLTTGCTATTKNLFAQGHDAKLKSALIRWGALGLDIRREEGGVATSADAVKHASRYAFGPMVKAGIARAEDKAAAKAERAAKREQAKAAQTRRTAAKTKQMAKKTQAEETAQVVKARVGRWQYTGVVEKGQFHYSTSKGEARTTSAYTVV